MSIRTRMTLSMLSAAALIIPVVVLAVFYIRWMNTSVNRIADQDIELMHIGDQISLNFAQARKGEKNFLLYGDSVYLAESHTALEDIAELCSQGRRLDPDLATRFDAIVRHTATYRHLADSLISLPQPEPRRVILPGLDRLRKLHQNLLDAAASAQDTVRRDSLLATAARLAAETALPIPGGLTGRTLNDTIRALQTAVSAETDSITVHARQRVLRHRHRARLLAAWGQRNILTVLFIVLVLLAWLIVTLPRKAVLPIKRIVNALRRAEQGDLNIRIKPGTRDELGDLTQRLNRVFARLQAFDERKKNRILHLERRFRLLINDIAEGVLVVDRTPNVVLANKAVEPLLGCRASEASGKPLKTFSSLDFLNEPLERVLAGATSHQTCDILSELPGSVVCIEALRDEAGKVTGALVVITRPEKPEQPVS